MALTSTERARRSRRHARGQHDLCDPKRCSDAAPPAAAAADTRTRGERLRDVAWAVARMRAHRARPAPDRVDVDVDQDQPRPRAGGRARRPC